MLVELKMLLLRRGIAQIELARQTGMNTARISRIIRGRIRPRARDRRRIARALGAAESKLFPRKPKARRHAVKPADKAKKRCALRASN
jgi:transcriptional regulator with XRE-family HTH domain